MERQPEQTGGVTSAESRAEWIRPQVDRFIAGGAEASTSGPTFDGADFPS